MKTILKRFITVSLVVLGFGIFSKAHAANPDTMTISVTPTVTYGVSITSVNAGGYSFTTVALAFSTISTAAIILTNTGTIHEYFSLAVSNTSPDGWTPGAAGAAGANQFGLIGFFNSTQPDDSAFVGGNALTGSIPGAAAALYGQASTKTIVGGTKNLWLKLNMPLTLSTGTGGAQTMVLSVNGQSL